MDELCQSEHYLTSKALILSHFQPSPIGLLNPEVNWKTTAFRIPISREWKSFNVSRRRINSEGNIKSEEPKSSAIKNCLSTQITKTRISSSECKQKSLLINNKFSNKNFTKRKDTIKTDNAEKYDPLLNKVPRHWLRKKRQQYDIKSGEMEREYRHTVQQLQKDRKSKEKQQGRKKRIESSKQQYRKTEEELKQIGLENQLETLKYKESLKERILDHRQRKQYIIQQIKYEKSRMGSQQRLLSKALSRFAEQSVLADLQQKRRLNSKEKEDDLKRKHLMNSRKESRKLEARTKFRNKWINQYEKSVESKQRFYKRHEQLTKKMRQALQGRPNKINSKI